MIPLRYFRQFHGGMQVHRSGPPMIDFAFVDIGAGGILNDDLGLDLSHQIFQGSWVSQIQIHPFSALPEGWILIIGRYRVEPGPGLRNQVPSQKSNAARSQNPLFHCRLGGSGSRSHRLSEYHHGTVLGAIAK